MKEFKGTPGPWFRRTIGAERVTGQLAVIQTDGEDVRGYHVAYSPGWTDEKETEEEAKANARLIAAAPDLLDALISVRDGVKSDSPELWGKVDAAIAKALGEEQ